MTEQASTRPSTSAELVIDEALIGHPVLGATDRLYMRRSVLAALGAAGYVVVPREDFVEVLTSINHNASQEEQDAAERLIAYMAELAKESQRPGDRP